MDNQLSEGTAKEKQKEETDKRESLQRITHANGFPHITHLRAPTFSLIFTLTWQTRQKTQKMKKNTGAEAETETLPRRPLPVPAEMHKFSSPLFLLSSSEDLEHFLHIRFTIGKCRWGMVGQDR